MGPVRDGIADAVNQRDLTLVVHILDGGQSGIEAEVIVYRQNLVLRNRHVGAIVVIQRVAVRNDGIEVVIPSSKLDHHQNRVFLGSGHWPYS